MKTISLSLKLLLAVALITISGTSEAVSRFYIKNDSSYDIKIKFAAPDNTRAFEDAIASQNSYSAGTIDDMYDVVHLSVRRSGIGSSFVSGFTALNTAELRKDSKQYLSEPTITGYERDIYWVIMPTYTGWTAKAQSVQRKK